MVLEVIMAVMIGPNGHPCTGWKKCLVIMIIVTRAVDMPTLISLRMLMVLHEEDTQLIIRILRTRMQQITLMRQLTPMQQITRMPLLTHILPILMLLEFLLMGQTPMLLVLAQFNRPIVQIDQWVHYPLAVV